VEGSKFGILILCLPAFCITALSRWLAIQATDAWSDPIRSLVNLGRVKLADRLGLQLPAKLEEEKEMWGLVTKYVYYATDEFGVPLDKFRKGFDAPDKPVMLAEIIGGEATVDRQRFNRRTRNRRAKYRKSDPG
jgi:hypothetical protein